METQGRLHPPAMVVECLRFLRADELADEQRRDPGRAITFVDCTLGTGGHTQSLLDAGPDFRVVGIDLDAEAIELVQQRLAAYGSRLTCVHGNYRDVRAHLDNLGIDQVDGLLIDAGVSLWQLDSPERGFSFRFDAPLNMSFDRSSQRRTAYDLVNTLAERELASLIREYSDERWAERIARSIVAARRRETLRTTAQLAAIIKAAIPARYRTHDIDPATRTFAALRQSTNDELGSLEAAIPNAATSLAPNAVMVALTYSTNEDRIVKHQLKRLTVPTPRRQRYSPSQQLTPVLPTSSSRVLASHQLVGTHPMVGTDSPDVQPCLRILTPKPVLPSREEIRANPRCRGARLRAAARA